MKANRSLPGRRGDIEVNREKAVQGVFPISAPEAERSGAAVAARKLWERLAGYPTVLVGGLVVLVLAVIALLAPVIAPYPPLEMNIVDRLQAPSAAHWLGTDEFGRDVLSRIIYGSRISMGVGFAVVAIASVVGMVLGICSAFYKALDNMIMRVNDGLMAFPEILLAIAIVAALGPGKSNVVIALCIVYSPLVARVVRSVAIVEREKTYVEAMKVLGAGSWRIMTRHILPNCMAPFIVQITFIFAQTIIVEASLSFLGAGTPPQFPSWGNILSEGVVVMQEAWWITVFPGLVILVLVLALNLLGDGLRDMLDPSVHHKR